MLHEPESLGLESLVSDATGEDGSGPARTRPRKRDTLLALTLGLLSVVLAAIPTGYEKPMYMSAERVRARVIEADNSQVMTYGIVKQGEQFLTVRILDGTFKGSVENAVNTVLGKMDLDKIFSPGDVALASVDIDPKTGRLSAVTLIDHYRVGMEIILTGLFLAALILFAGWTGFKAFVSFVFGLLVIWKVLIPGFLAGFDPVLVSLATVAILTCAIIFLVAGINRVGVTAVLGCLLGIAVTCTVGMIVAGPFHLNGAVRPFSETLLYSGYPHLDLTRIFLAGVFLASSGAVMDLGMDIASAMAEVHRRHPGISSRELIASGFRVGRAVLGTMTTTLLLAYTGGFTSLLMVFMAQGIPIINMFNLSFISCELFHTIVGSFGLVMSAPCTAILGGFMLTGKRSSVGFVRKLREEEH